MFLIFAGIMLCFYRSKMCVSYENGTFRYCWNKIIWCSQNHPVRLFSLDISGGERGKSILCRNLMKNKNDFRNVGILSLAKKAGMWQVFLTRNKETKKTRHKMERNEQMVSCQLSCLGLRRLPCQPVEVAELLQGRLSENQHTQLYQLNVLASSHSLLLAFFFVSPSADGIVWIPLAALREGEWESPLRMWT